MSVKTIEGHLYCSVRNVFLPFEELTILLVQVEAISNSRPLVVPSEDPKSELTLSLAHFLIDHRCKLNPNLM